MNSIGPIFAALTTDPPVNVNIDYSGTTLSNPEVSYELQYSTYSTTASQGNSVFSAVLSVPSTSNTCNIYIYAKTNTQNSKMLISTNYVQFFYWSM